MTSFDWLKAITGPGLGPSLVGGIATLLAMISLRNSDVASRCRKNNEELIRLAETPRHWHAERRDCLLQQNEHFQVRYNRLSRAFMLALSGLVAFLTACALAPCAKELPYLSAALAFTTTFFALFFASFILLVWEFWAGNLTLGRDTETAERISRSGLRRHGRSIGL